MLPSAVAPQSLRLSTTSAASCSRTTRESCIRGGPCSVSVSTPERKRSRWRSRYRPRCRICPLQCSRPLRPQGWVAPRRIKDAVDGFRGSQKAALGATSVPCSGPRSGMPRQLHRLPLELRREPQRFRGCYSPPPVASLALSRCPGRWENSRATSSASDGDAGPRVARRSRDSPAAGNGGYGHGSSLSLVE